MPLRLPSPLYPACVRACAAALLIGASAAAQGLTIYTEINAPLQFEGDQGQLTGLAVEVVREIQRRVGSTEAIQLVPWARGYLDLQSLPDVALFSTARTAERNHRFKWVGPYDETAFGLFVRAGSRITLKSLEDARKLHAIGVYTNDVQDLYLTQAGFRNLQRSVDNVANVKKLMAGRIDAFASAPASIEQLARSAGCRAGDLKEAFVFLRSQWYIAFSSRTPDATVNDWSAAFEAMKADHTFERIYHRYYPHRALPGPADLE